ncbi:hypothetical protein H9P43_005402 [Blastocladiella emersonii ATCC 22665]|nr:hypothetical protein H9P43_005402 [Blastocladiella emersonii ATCC 22665]
MALSNATLSALHLPICKLHKTGETEFGPPLGVVTPIRVIRVAKGVCEMDLCTRRGYSPADLYYGKTFASASALAHLAVDSLSAAWIGSFDGHAYEGARVALTPGKSGADAGSVTVPAGGCAAKLDAIVW